MKKVKLYTILLCIVLLTVSICSSCKNSKKLFTPSELLNEIKESDNVEFTYKDYFGDIAVFYRTAIRSGKLIEYRPDIEYDKTTGIVSSGNPTTHIINDYKNGMYYYKDMDESYFTALDHDEFTQPIDERWSEFFIPIAIKNIEYLFVDENFNEFDTQTRRYTASEEGKKNIGVDSDVNYYIEFNNDGSYTIIVEGPNHIDTECTVRFGSAVVELPDESIVIKKELNW